MKRRERSLPTDSRKGFFGKNISMTWITHTTFAFFGASFLGLNVPLAVVGSTAPDWFEDLFGLREHKGMSH